jgi:transposase
MEVWMRTLSLDLRQRILACYDNGEGSQVEVARRFHVSHGMVKKLLWQRKRTGEIGSQHHRSGRKPKILDSHKREMRALLAKKPDMTLEELREVLQLDCTLPAIHYALDEMGLTYKKRHSERASKSGRTSLGRGGPGSVGKRGLTLPNSSSSTSREQRRT